MTELQFEFCPLSEKIIPYVLDHETVEDTVFIFPNENSVKQAVRYFQNKWQFSDTLLITIDSLKNQIFLADKPLLREEKRTLAFYASLTQQDKDYFKIRSYFQAIELAHHFFTLWEEFNDECIGPGIVEKLVNENVIEFLDWQIAQFRRMIDIREQYQVFISQRGFTDNLFVRHQDNLDTAFFHSYKRFIFVNQFYYTRLEKQLINAVQQADKHAVLYYQLPFHLVDQETLDVAPFQVSDLLNGASVKQVTINECTNDFSVMVSLMQCLQKNPDIHIIDPAFSRNTWAGMVSPDRFNMGDSLSFTHSSIYRFFGTLYNILDAIFWEEKKGRYLLPVQTLLDAVMVPEFMDYFYPDNGRVQRQQIRNLLYDVIDQDYKYIDIEPGVYSPKDYRELLTLITPLLEFIQRFKNINNLQDWIDRIDGPARGIVIRDIVKQDEQEHSNLPEVFYRLLADLKAIESIGIVNNWDDFFPSVHPQIKVWQSGSNLLRIMIDYMKAKTFQWQTETKGPRFEISNLNDTRNMTYNTIAVLNVIEGKIPSQRITPYLFTDKQRQHMHLKTWDNIRQREHYYFSRLVLSTPRVYLYTMKNMEKNIEVSSFIEELLLNLPPERCQIIREKSHPGAPVYSALLECANDLPDKTRVGNRSFFSIPLHVKADFPQGMVKMSYTSFRDLKKNPFLYFVRDFCRVQAMPKKSENDFSPRLIGNIAHDAVTECWRLLNPEKINPFTFKRSDLTEELVQQAIGNIEQRSRYYYSILHDYTYIFFANITRSTLIEGILGFFDLLVEQGLEKTLYIYPEEEESTRDEMRYKVLLPAADNALQLDMAFRGRADLRIIDPDEDMYYIFDFKTGQYDKEQLIIYEQLYRLLQEPEAVEKVSSFFYQLFKKEVKELRDYLSARGGLKTKADLFRAFHTDLLAIAADLEREGFALPAQKSKMTDIPGISRKDLFLAQQFGDERE